MNNFIICPGCLAPFEENKDDEVSKPHCYIDAVHTCWNIYSEILAKEFSHPDYFAIHRITVDSYAAQHIGDQTDRRARQSANLHLIALYLYYEKKFEIRLILEFLQKATTDKVDWPPIIQLTCPTWLTVHDVLPASNAHNHIELVTQWGKSVWKSYNDQHDSIIRTYNTFCV